MSIFADKETDFADAGSIVPAGGETMRAAELEKI